MVHYLKKMSSILFLTLCFTCTWYSFFSSIPSMNLPSISTLGDGTGGNPPIDQY